MTRLIDADALIQAINNQIIEADSIKDVLQAIAWKDAFSGLQSGRKDAIAIIESAPTVHGDNPSPSHSELEIPEEMQKLIDNTCTE